VKAPVTNFTVTLSFQIRVSMIKTVSQMSSGRPEDRGSIREEAVLSLPSRPDRFWVHALPVRWVPGALSSELK
jgi:hypothetical protein